MQISFKYANRLGKREELQGLQKPEVCQPIPWSFFFSLEIKFSSQFNQYGERKRDCPEYCSPSEKSWPVWKAKTIFSVGENEYRKKAAGHELCSSFTPIQWSIEKVAANVDLLNVHKAVIFEVLRTWSWPLILFCNLIMTPLDSRSSLEGQVSLYKQWKKEFGMNFWEINILQILNNFRFYLPDGLY